jgi:hypothetical protein
MAHVRTTIRERVRDIVAAALSTHDVSSSRKFARNVTARPTVDMKPVSEDAEFTTMNQTLQTRSLSLAVRISRRSADGVEDDLDADEAIITPALCGAVWTDICEDSPIFTRAQWMDESDGGVGISCLVLQFDFEYRLSTDDLEQPEG